MPARQTDSVLFLNCAVQINRTSTSAGYQCAVTTDSRAHGLVDSFARDKPRELRRRSVFRLFELPGPCHPFRHGASAPVRTWKVPSLYHRERSQDLDLSIAVSDSKLILARPNFHLQKPRCRGLWTGAAASARLNFDLRLLHPRCRPVQIILLHLFIS